MRGAPVWILAAALAGPAARGETLPLRTYDVADGLAHSRVTSIMQARRGDVWFATWDGVSRFDGYRFTTFGTRDGLPGTLVTSMAEDRHGGLWLGTFDAGLARLLDDPRERGRNPNVKFATVRVAEGSAAAQIGALSVDAANQLWCATTAGIFRADLNAAAVVFEPVLPGVAVSWPQQLAVEPRGRAWAAGGDGVWEVEGGRAVRHPVPAEARGDMWNVALARAGGLWVTTGQQLWRLTPRGEGRPADHWDRVPIALRDDNYFRVLAESESDGLWIGTMEGLLRWRDEKLTIFTTDNGLPDDKVRALRIDIDGNLWLGTHNGGAARLPPGGLVNITRSDGLTDRNVLHVVEARDGRIYATTDRAAVVEIEGGRARPVPGSERRALRDVHLNLVQDRFGNWWMGRGNGVYRFDGPILRLDRGRRLGARDGLPDPDALVMGLCADTDGTLWLGQGGRFLAHIRPSVDGRPVVETVPLPDPGSDWLPRRVLRDRSGALWVSSFLNLGRLLGGAIVSLSGSPGLPGTDVRWLHLDRRGRMWLGHRNHGVSMTERPDAPRPVFRNWTTRDGLSSDAVWTIGEDDAGRIFLGTARGLDRIDPDSGRILAFGPADGLAGGTVNSILADSHGRLWAATSGGLSVLDPSRMRDAVRAPPAYISRVALAGEDLPLPESGLRRLDGLVLPRPGRTIAFEWVGVGFETGGPLRFQTKLEGADRDWSAPSEARTVHYARLGAGSYSFQVRSVTAGGEPEDDHATVHFRILPPLWLRGWFIAMSALVAAAVAYGVHALRVRRLVALERVRRQIATDLHDEVGSGLAQVAVLSEVAKRHATPEGVRLLAEVADVARSLRESMGDIVWAVDPRKDRLADLVMRLRQVANNLLASEGVAVTFDAPPDDEVERIELAPDRKRHLFLAAKEALTNAARHARASTVRVAIAVHGSTMFLSVVDDGRGFAPAEVSEGRGLSNIERRARALGGRVALEASPGRGVSLKLEVPLHGHLG